MSDIQDERVHQFLHFWFGDLGVADLPDTERATLWFGEKDILKKEMVERFKPLFDEASSGKLVSWEESSRGRLALIILFDQFPRYYFRREARAFLCDGLAQSLAQDGVKAQLDKKLTLIERVFFYMPFVHSEDLYSQEAALSFYQELVALSMPESTQIYQLFLAYSYAHFRLIKEYGRFPQRNELLGRKSSVEEIAFLKTV